VKVFILFILSVLILVSCGDDNSVNTDYDKVEIEVISIVSGNPVEGALVKVNPDFGNILTNDKGEIIIPNVESGKYELIISKNGYFKETYTFQKEEGKRKQVTIELTETPEGLVAYLPFDGGFQDESSWSNPINSSDVSLVKDVNGVSNSACFFNGESSGLIFQNQENVQLNDGYTIAFWINPEPDYGEYEGNEIHLVGRFDSFGNSSFSLSLWGIGKIGTLKQIGKENFIDSTNYVIPPNQWTHLSVTFDTNKLKFFVNGEFIEEISRMGQLDESTAELSIGCRAFLSGLKNRFFHGALDEIMIFNRALTDQEINLLYQ
jgi:hypothetical protein